VVLAPVQEDCEVDEDARDICKCLISLKTNYMCKTNAFTNQLLKQPNFILSKTPIFSIN